jgi:hypothetical protein
MVEIQNPSPTSGVNTQLAHIDFTDKPDGLPPARLDTGQPVDFTFNASGRRAAISNGRLVVNNQAGAGSGSLADYYQSDLGIPIRRVGCEWTQPVGANDGNGNSTYAAWASYYEGAGSNVPASWVHMSIVPGSGTSGTAKFFVCNGVGNMFVVKQQTFVNPPADGVTRWVCESVLDLDAGVVYSWLPDGSIMSATNADIAFMCGVLSIPVFTFADVANVSVIMCEHYADTGASAATYGGFTGMWGETVDSLPPRRKDQGRTLIDAARTALSLRTSIPVPAASVVYAPTTQFSTTTTTGATNIESSNSRVTQVAGPGGKIIFQASAYYEWAANDTLFWRMAAGNTSAARAAFVGVTGQKGLVTQQIEISGLNPGQSYTYTLQHWTAIAGSAICKAGGSGGGTLPPLTLLALPG